MSTLANEEVEMQTLENKKRLEEEFYEYFSFGKYLELHQRVEYLEDELDRRKLVTKRKTSHYQRAFTHKNALYNGKEGFSDDEDGEFKSLPTDMQAPQQENPSGLKAELIINRSDEVPK